MFKGVSEAYDTLSDVKKRGEYDSKFVRQNSDQNKTLNPSFSDREYAQHKQIGKTQSKTSSRTAKN